MKDEDGKKRGEVKERKRKRRGKGEEKKGKGEKQGIIIGLSRQGMTI